MIERVEDKTTSSRTGAPSEPLANLPYRIELWQEAGGGAVEQVLARAFTAPLARAIFEAARREHPGRRITLRHRARILADAAI